MDQLRDSKGRFVSAAIAGNRNGNGSLYAPRYDPIAINQLSAAIQNASTLTRSSLLQTAFDPRRSINDDCGYPETEQITVEEYRRMFDRNPVAARVVELMSRECWKLPPAVFESEDADDVTPFEEAWDSLGRSLRLEQSWYQDELGSPVWEVLERLDVLTGIGSYGVLLLGFNDTADLEQPVAGLTFTGRATVGNQQDRGTNGRRLLYVRPLDQSLAQVASVESDSRNPRFGQPKIYNITLTEPNSQLLAPTGSAYRSVRVHWSRLVHVADGLNSSEVFGTSRQLGVWDHLLNVRKLYGGSAEMYWRGAFPGLSFETNPQLGGDVTVDTSALRDQAEQFMNTLQRYIATSGMTVKSIAPQVVDPTPQLNVQIEGICIKLGIPKRIFVGSERGELASSQDARAWNSRVKGRQNGFVTPRIIVPFVDRLIAVGVLPEPKEGYSVQWPDLDTITPEERAGLAAKRTEAMAKYIQGNVDSLMLPLDYLTRELDYAQDEAAAMLEAVMQEQAAEEEDVEEKDVITEPVLQDGEDNEEPDDNDQTDDDNNM